MARALPWLGPGATGPVRVVTASPDTVLAEALSSFLDDQDGIEVVGLTFGADRLVEAMGVLRPDVLLCDQRVAAPTAPLLQACTDAHPDLRTVLLATMVAPRRGDERAANAVVPPHSSMDAVVAAVREAAWQPAVLTAAVDEPPPDLSSRELEVLRLVAHGEGTDEIASTLHLSPHTVRNHLSRLGRKLGTHSRIEAVTTARRHGIL